MGYHLHGQNKNAGANNTRFLAMSLAPALDALAFDIQDDLRFAVPAVDWEMLRPGLGRHSE